MIAASIPLLKPLADLIMGRRTFSSNRSGQKYEKYSRSQSGQGDTDVELSHSVGRSRKRDFSNLETIVVGAASCDEDRVSSKSNGNDSQAEILSDEADRHRPTSRPLSGGIMRTVTVTTSTYEIERDEEFSVRPV